MKRIFGTLKRRPSSTLNANPAYPDDSPEGKIINEVNAFCESGRDPAKQGNEFVHLPAIVESAESSPNAAKEAAYRIRKLLSDPASTPAYMQYNAIMLIRILVDNPGHTFTRNLDAKFVATTKLLLRNGRDMRVQHFLRETLQALEAQRSWDDDLSPLLEMWGKEKDKLKRTSSTPSWWPTSSSDSPRKQETVVPRTYPPGTLPPPDELAARVAEAKTSANLLVQFVQSTPVTELFENELVKEFSDRCRTASRSIQGYINATDPSPDENTLSTLIETSDELSVALSRYHSAILKARKALGTNGSPSPAPSSSSAASATGAVRPPAPPPRRSNQASVPAVPETAPVTASAPTQVVAPVPVLAPAPAQEPTPPAASGGLQNTSNGFNRYQASQYEYRSEDFQVQNPFADNFTTDNTPGQRTGEDVLNNTQRTERTA